MSLRNYKYYKPDGSAAPEHGGLQRTLGRGRLQTPGPTDRENIIIFSFDNIRQFLTWPPKSRAAKRPTQLCSVYMLGLGSGLA